MRAVSGLNPFGKAAESANDIVVVPVGGNDEATLNNEGEPQQAPPERKRRQVSEGRPSRRDLGVEEVYYEAEDSQYDLFAGIRDVRQFENSENRSEEYYRQKPGDVDTRDDPGRWSGVPALQWLEGWLCRNQTPGDRHLVIWVCLNGWATQRSGRQAPRSIWVHKGVT